MKKEIIKNLDSETRRKIIHHFNTIYECNKIDVMEENLIYLLYLEKNNLIFDDGEGFWDIKSEVKDIEMEDFKLENTPFNVKENPLEGVNLAVTYELFELDKLKDLINFEKS